MLACRRFERYATTNIMVYRLYEHVLCDSSILCDGRAGVVRVAKGCAAQRRADLVVNGLESPIRCATTHPFQKPSKPADIYRILACTCAVAAIEMFTSRRSCRGWVDTCSKSCDPGRTVRRQRSWTRGFKRWGEATLFASPKAGEQPFRNIRVGKVSFARGDVTCYTIQK